MLGVDLRKLLVGAALGFSLGGLTLAIVGTPHELPDPGDDGGASVPQEITDLMPSKG